MKNLLEHINNKNLINDLNNIKLKANSSDLELQDFLLLMIYAQQQISLELNTESNNLLSELSHHLSNSSQAIASSLYELKKLKHISNPLRLENYGFSVGSQSDEDGMIAEVFNRIGFTNKVCMEFGVGVGRQCMSFALLMQGWKCYWHEINKPKVEFINNFFKDFINTSLFISDTAITPANFDEVCASKLPREIDFLSIDIDGNDYHVLEKMEYLKPRFIVAEYNALYPPPMKVIQKYDPQYVHDINTYIGASLQGLSDMLEKKGYTLVGTNITGISSFWVLKELVGDKFDSPGNLKYHYNSCRGYLGDMGAFREKGWPGMSPIEKS